MKTAVINLYSFDELDDKVADRILESYREEMEIDYDPVIEGAKEELEKIGASDIDIFWSGFYSQGDGACFCCDFDAEKILNTLFKDNTDYDKIRYLSNEIGLIDMKIVSRRCGPSNFYSHENTVEAFITCRIYDSQIASEDRALIDALEKDMTEFIRSKCRKIYADLEEHYEVCTSLERILDDLREQGECFTKSGHVITFIEAQ